MPRPHLLPALPDMPPELTSPGRQRPRPVRAPGLPRRISTTIFWQRYGLDMTASMPGIPSATLGQGVGPALAERAQVEEAADAGLGFVVLKTVIAQDARAAVDGRLGDQGVADGRRADQERRDRRGGLDRSPGRAAAGGSRSTTTSSWSATACAIGRERGCSSFLGQVPPSRRPDEATWRHGRVSSRRPGASSTPIDGGRTGCRCRWRRISRPRSPARTGGPAGAIVLELARSRPRTDPRRDRARPGPTWDSSSSTASTTTRFSSRCWPRSTAEAGPISSSTPTVCSIPSASSKASAAWRTAAPT